MQLNHVASTPSIVPAIIAPPVPSPLETASARDTDFPFILFGLDQRGRPHAACLVGHKAEVVERVADAMDLYCIAADTDDLRDMTAKLAVGRIFSKSGKAFVPFCNGSVYDRLLAAAGITVTPRPVKAAGKAAEAEGSPRGGSGGGAGGAGAGGPPAARAGVRAPADHSQIGIGSRVLAEASDEDGGGYWVAEVVATKADDALQLIWCGFDLPEFARPRRALALLHPDAVVAGE